MSDVAPKKSVKSPTPGSGMVFDVSRPGRAPVSSTSKPVIVGHKPQVRDPFTTGRAGVERPLMSTKQQVSVQPTDEAESKGEAPPSGAATAELAAVAAELAAQPEVTTPEGSKPVPAPAMLVPKPELMPTPSATNDDPTPASQSAEEDPGWEAEKPEAGAATVPSFGTQPEAVVTKPTPLSPELKKELEAATNDDSAADPKGVIVSGSHGSLGVWKMLIWFLAVIVLVVVVGDLLLDAGTITTSVSIPHTHFIK